MEITEDIQKCLNDIQEASEVHHEAASLRSDKIDKLIKKLAEKEWTDEQIEDFLSEQLEAKENDCPPAKKHKHKFPWMIVVSVAGAALVFGRWTKGS